MRIFLVGQQSVIGNIIRTLGSGFLPNTVVAIKEASNLVMSEWIKAVKKCSSKEGWKAAYIDSIHKEETKDPLTAVVSTLEKDPNTNEDVSKFVNFVEDGVKRFDMKPGLLNGPKARISEDGKSYNIIFMRKGVPGTQHISNMGQNVYATVSQMGKTKSARHRVVGIGDAYKNMVGNMVSDQVGKVFSSSLKAKARSLNKRIYSGNPDKFKGVGGKKDKSAGMMKAGSWGHSQYGTFRVVTSTSKGWIYPGVSASPVFSTFSTRIEPKVYQIIEAGFLRDMEDGLETFIKTMGAKKR